MPWIDWFRTERGNHLPEGVSDAAVKLGRVGFAARGVVYLSIGLLALMAAVGMEQGEATDAGGAMEAIRDLPLGWALVVAVAAGLAGYALWRVVQAVFNLENYDKSTRSTCWRLYQLADGLFHAGFAVFVLMALTRGGGGEGSDGDSTREWTAQLMAQPAGRWLVGLVGVVTVASGLYLLYRAYSAPFAQALREDLMGEAAERVAVWMGRAGETARGVVFVMFGVFLTQSAIRFDPDEARGVGESMLVLAAQPMGRWLFGLVALGLVLYGVYSLMEAWYRKKGRGTGASEEESAQVRSS